MISQVHKDQIRRRMRGLTAMPLDAGHVFYDRLFRMLPEVRPLFGEDIDAQSEKLIDMVFLVVHFLDGVEALAPEIEELGERHVAYGVKPAHLASAKEAFLEAMAATLDDWTHEDQAAWDALLTSLTQFMLQGLEKAQTDTTLKHSA